jgi:hypothetical protein
MAYNGRNMSFFVDLIYTPLLDIHSCVVDCYFSLPISIGVWTVFRYVKMGASGGML